MHQHWELIRVLYLRARIGWIALGLFWLLSFLVTMINFDPARPAAATFLWVYFSAVALGMSGAALGAETYHPALRSLWRRLPGALPLVRTGVLLVGCGLWGMSALGGAILALWAGSLAPLTGTLGAASAGLGVGFGLLQNTAPRIAWSLAWLAIAVISGFAVQSGLGAAKPDLPYVWSVFQYLLMPVWPAVWFAYRPDLTATPSMPSLWFKLLRFFEHIFPAPPLPPGRADPGPLMSTRLLNTSMPKVFIAGFFLVCGWLLRDLPFLFLTALLILYVPMFQQLADLQWLSPRLMSLPNGLFRARIADTLFRLYWRGRIRTTAAYGLIWLAGLWLFGTLTAAQALALMAITVSAAILSAAWTIALQPLLGSQAMLGILSPLLTALTVSGSLLAAQAAGWHEQLNGVAAALWALAEFALAYSMAWGLVRLSRGRWARYDLQHLVNYFAKLRPARQHWNSILNKEHS